MKKLIILLLAVLFSASVTLQAQGRRGLRINEVMVVNDSNTVDDFGRHVAWVELFNSTFAPLEISSVYLTNDRNNPKLYPVPLGDVNTKIPKRQHILFWADGEPNKGTFHTSFVLEPGKDNFIAIYDADGKSLIDSVLVPASLQAGQTYARAEDGFGAWEVRDGSESSYITPSSANKIKSLNHKIEQFSEHDPDGFAMAVMAMAIVFSALLVLSLCFLIISKINEKLSKSRKAKALESLSTEKAVITTDQHDSGEEIAAIAMALNQHLFAHDTESTILTINKVRRAYSPWSSKIYGLRSR